jgi:hypothetical protein
MTRATVSVQRASSPCPCERCLELPSATPHGADFEVWWREGVRVSVRVCAAQLAAVLSTLLVVERDVPGAARESLFCTDCGEEGARA